MNTEEHRPGRSGRKVIITILFLLLIVAIGTSGLLFIKYKHAIGTAPSNERQHILDKIGTVVSLPDEQPDLTTVLDTSKLSNQTLRERANNGDKLLIYNKARRLVIYRPSTGKVVDMLTIQKPSQAASDSTGQ